MSSPPFKKIISPSSDGFNFPSGLIFLVILGLAAVLRFTNIDGRSLTQDESTMLEFTKGLLEYGYPALLRGESQVLMATYELLPYFIAPMVYLLGWSEFSVRLPAVIFSLGTLCLIFIAARSWFGNRIALWASFLYAISPWSLYWAQSCFYPSQVQFFTMLSTVLVYRILNDNQAPAWCYYATAISLSLTYLSWEASGMLFLVYGMLALWLRWGRWDYILTSHAWLALLIVGSVVIGQLVRRTMLRESFLIVGSSRADISTPQLAMKQPTFDPYYYLQNIFFSEQLLILSIFFLVGIFFLRSNWKLCFVYGFTLLGIAAYTVLLPVQAVRYVFVLLPLFLISASAATFLLLDWTTLNRGPSNLLSLRVITPACMVIVLAVQGAAISSHGLNLAEMNSRYQGPPPWELRPDIIGVDFRHTAHILGENYREGDIIIARGPFLLHLYTGLKGDYALQKISASIVVYEPERGLPYYSDKWIGNPVLRNEEELKDVLMRHERVWFVATPLGPVQQVLGRELFNFIHESMTLVTEGHHVRLYLWEMD